MRKFGFFIVFILLVLTSCRKDFSFETNPGNLEFSKKTVYLDTVFTNIGSSTYRLKVYNRSDKDISIPKIQLQKGLSSKYRMMVDGIAGNGKMFDNVELLAKDSLFIFIETTAAISDVNTTDFLYTDKIQFFNSSNAAQTVDLVTLVKDAIFIYPERNNLNQYENINLGLDGAGNPITYIGSNLSANDLVNGDELHWTSLKPYVIYGYALVPDTKTLVVDAGVRAYFHAESGLIIAKNGTLQINGTNPPAGMPTSLQNEVTFEGDRLEPAYEDVAGQWGAIVNYSQTNGNLINHLTLKNATVGILNQPRLITDNYAPKMTINNSKILNCSNIGILNRAAVMDGKNLVLNYCGQSSLACTLGGSYTFSHCTFNNNWNSTTQLSVFLNNYLETQNVTYLNDLTQANFNNCIIYGSNQVEFLVDKKGTGLLNFNLKNSLLKFNNIDNPYATNPLYQFSTDGSRYSNCYLATNSTINNPKFENPSKNKFWLSQQWNPALVPAPGFIFNDIIGKPRTGIIALGAYQF